MKKYIITLSLLAFTVLSTFARELPDPPKGYTWRDFSEANISCLCPKGWNFKTYKDNDATTCKISPEEIKSDQGLKIGLSIHMIKNVTKKTKVSAYEYAPIYLAKIASEKEFISFSEAQDHGKLQLRQAEVIRKKDNQHILLRTFANKETDTLFIITFGAPTDKWEKYSAYKLIHEYMVLDDEI